MRTTIDLYIAGIKADISENALVLMNYRAEDLNSPAVVKNSYSQSLTLPGSPTNNAIFGHIARSDHHSGNGGAGVAFSALKKTEFKIIAADGQLLESGYVKLESIERKGSDVSYKITLFGGLGAFLYGLMYDAEGNKRSLADLDYNTDLTFAITRDAVRDAWRQHAFLDYTSAKWSVINFAPCYNGIPEGGFQANKAFIPTDCAGVMESSEGASSRRGHVLATLSQEYDEWQTKDLRSYLQRPIIKMSEIIDAICKSLNNGGYNVERDSVFFSHDNPYYSDTWLTLPSLADIQLQPTAGSDSSEVASSEVSLNGTYDVSISVVGSTAMSTEYSASVKIKPQLHLTALHSGDVYAAWEIADQPTGRRAYRYGCLYQLIAYDAAGRVIAGSKVAMATTASIGVDGIRELPTAYTPATFVQMWNNDNSLPIEDYTPAWIESGYEDSAVVGDAYHFDGTGTGTLQTGGIDNELTLSLSARGVARLALRVTTLGAYQTTANYLFRTIASDVIDASYNAITMSGMGSAAAMLNYSYESSGIIRSGSTITQRMLLGGTASPADYLLGYVKMFGLQLAYDGRTKTIKILSRNTFYDGETIDLTNVIDRQSVAVTPYILDSRWYVYGNEAVEGAFIKYYNSVNNRAYGVQRVNTGFEFNADEKQVLEGVIYRTAAETLAQGKYYANIMAQGKVYPSPLLDGGTYTLWTAEGDTKSFDVVQPGTLEVEYLDYKHRGYDYPLASKAQLCDGEGKAAEGENVLLMYDYNLVTDAYRHYCLSDDNSLMSVFNGGEACWLLGQSALPDNADYCIGEALPIPLFRRYKTRRNGERREVVYSLDMGTPRELGAYSIELSDADSIYHKAWRRYIADRYDADSRVMTCKANLRALGSVGVELLRHFYYYDGALWALNAIKDHSLCTDDMTEIELVKVTDKSAYDSGQAFLVAQLNIESYYTIPRLGETREFPISSTLIDTSSLAVAAPAWITATISGNTLTLVTGSNPTTNERSGEVVVSAVSIEGETITAVMDVEQTGAYSLTITPERRTIGSRDFADVSFAVSYEGSDALVVSTDAAWLNVAIYNNATIVASANSSNNTASARTATIRVTGSGVSREVYVTQMVGLSVSTYVVTANNAQIDVIEGGSYYNINTPDIGDGKGIDIEVVLYIPTGSDVPAYVSGVITGGNAGGTPFNMSYVGSYAPSAPRYKTDNPLMLSALFDGTTQSGIMLDISGDTLANNTRTFILTITE